MIRWACPSRELHPAVRAIWKKALRNAGIARKMATSDPPCLIERPESCGKGGRSAAEQSDGRTPT